ncbi:MAG: uncharacterized protein KVP18_000813 [Porospora cf. gigantea A]|uniref:uncharacterized protein n=1 Tax=Porospora cf. gigantea A TaxID=2853593 RepID=UPI00355AA70E|nr:MAG: hypothetical protein KVP18_000813 [Porospora cf. gigantea A]
MQSYHLLLTVAMASVTEQLQMQSYHLLLTVAMASVTEQLQKIDVKTVATLEVLLKRHYEQVGQADGPLNP